MKNQKTTTWTLISMVKNESTNEKTFKYVDEKGRFIELEAHPKRAFCYHINSSDDVSKKEESSLLDGYIRNGVKQHEYVGGFYEAISKIII